MVQFYKMRWGIEVEFRGLKQTLDRAKLRSRNDRRLLAELDWSLMAMAVAELFALREQLATRPRAGGQNPPAADPARRGLANTMRAIRRCIRLPDSRPEAGADLLTLLRNAVTDRYQRKKPKRARYRPLRTARKNSLITADAKSTSSTTRRESPPIFPQPHHSNWKIYRSKRAWTAAGSLPSLLAAISPVDFDLTDCVFPQRPGSPGEDQSWTYFNDQYAHVRIMTAEEKENGPH